MSTKDVKRPPAGPRAEAKRLAILKAARELFLREGFDVSVDLIAAEAGVSKVTVYNHFGSKEALFTGVVKDSLDAPLGGTLVSAIARLADSDDLRASLIAAARAWVAGIRTDPEILALRNVVARELHRFPELGKGWHDAGPERHHPVVAGALRQLVAQGRLDVPDIEVALLQLYSLLVFPYLVFSAYGTDIDDDLTDRLITGGVDMFLGHYAPRHTEP
ncbi:TetR/AcrR family transcriptional regulator [Streptomyces sp. RLB1-33]|uniref:TetR/AcrR family transcriptional regulator n=1 Tax=Streptomyces mirabilis TaxID=68239 RepID=UPI00143E2CCC|nr:MULTISPECIES: TetR/AcrR family transcriptional regulator [Streptomyces]QIY69173.1 TetR/AcrR family transcriptional regulator [Streptomyces sp. RLB1-33]QUW84049.1 TetR/AcrR family transcriptional regulator [Streptomyces mirabilis]